MKKSGVTVNLPAEHRNSRSSSNVRARGCESSEADSGASLDWGRKLQNGNVVVRGGIAVAGVESDGGDTRGDSTGVAVLPWTVSISFDQLFEE
jgi:hypothetical protein